MKITIERSRDEVQITLTRVDPGSPTGKQQQVATAISPQEADLLSQMLGAAARASSTFRFEYETS